MILVETLDLVDQYLLDRRITNDRLAKCFLSMTRFTINHGPGAVDIELLTKCDNGSQLDNPLNTNLKNRKNTKKEAGRIVSKKDQILELKENFASFIKDYLIPLAHLKASIDSKFSLIELQLKEEVE